MQFEEAFVALFAALGSVGLCASSDGVIGAEGSIVSLSMWPIALIMRPCKRLSVRGMPVSFQTFHQKSGRDPVGEWETR